ncbi:MAG: twin transmembrane helix small protein [Methylotenera sp.]|uniref:twin transmembrane helix small protein n=1 Tax=Methylotenera sp. TaxID=2051956 RepID=UPI00248A75AB|nr:twin transmembrane helix small protein [Methylotenera sp.]MDI1309687.1 twin transmembrane helix small protein [Methylotenera sp.]
MFIKIVVVLTLIVIVGSLLSALFFLSKDKTGGNRTVRALTIRIGLSIILFILLLIAGKFGLIGHPL